VVGMRRQSVAFFLGDPAFLSDAKFRALARRLPDPDDFNSAVGAFWIIVATARRNGSPVLDAVGETGSKFVDPLREVGLLTDQGLPKAAFEAWAPMSPQQAAAGKSRQLQADAAGLRNEKGLFVSSPVASSEPSGASALDRRTSADQPSPPLPSNPVKENDVDSLDGALDPRETDPEGPALTWLARHAIDIRPGNGYHQKLVVSVERHGVVALIREFETLAAAGMPSGDVKGFVFGAIDALDRARRPDLAAVAQADGAEREAERTRREVDRTRHAAESTRRRNSRLTAVGVIVGSLADHGVLPPEASS